MKNDLKTNLPFAKEIYSSNQHQIIVFIPIKDISDKNIGYFISLRDDNRIQEIVLSELIKFLVGLLFIFIIFYFWKQTKDY